MIKFKVGEWSCLDNMLPSTGLRARYINYSDNILIVKSKGFKTGTLMEVMGE